MSNANEYQDSEAPEASHLAALLQAIDEEPDVVETTHRQTGNAPSNAKVPAGREARLGWMSLSRRKESVPAPDDEVFQVRGSSVTDARERGEAKYGAIEVLDEARRAA